ncbi:MAG: hypothetical protein IMY76_00330 [Chloroflexi bacterium]|nr:hypothetical protein [Chloroflexota bacterium]
MLKKSTQPPKKKKIGSLVAIFRDRPLRWRDIFLTFIPGGLAVLTPLTYGVLRKNYALAYFGPIAAEIWSKPWFLLAEIALIAYLGLALRRLRRARQVVLVYKNGIAIRIYKNKSYLFYWDQLIGIACTTVQPIFIGRLLKRRHRVMLYPEHGKPITLNDRIPKIMELAGRIKAKIYPRLLPNLREKMSKGNPLNFGPITLQQDSLHLQGKAIPWDQITSINVQRGRLIVESGTNSPIKIPAGQIINIELLIQLLQDGVEI